MPSESNKASTSSNIGSSFDTMPPDLNSTVSTDPTTEFDGGALFKRLSKSSIRALNQADGIRFALHQDEIHMEHLIAGLLEKEDGPTKELL